MAGLVLGVAGLVPAVALKVPDRLAERFRSLLHGRRLLLVAGGIVVLVVASVASGVALASSSGSQYRTATAQIGSAEQTLPTAGTLAATNTADLSFEVSGAVQAVNVTPRQEVTAGEVLATIDTSSLESSVQSAQSQVTAAQEKLASDEASETDPSTDDSTTGSTGSTSSGSGATDPVASDPSQGQGSDPTFDLSGITSAQTTLTTDQQQTDNDSSNASAALQQAQTACDGSSAQGATTQAGSGSTTTSTDPASEGDAPETSQDQAQCASALQQALNDEATVSKDEGTVAQDESALGNLLSSAEGSIESNAASNASGSSSSRSSSSSSTAQAGAASTGNEGASSARTSTSSTSSSAIPAVAAPYQLAADQSALDADEASLSEAQAALQYGQLVAPFNGVVASVSLIPGQSVAAGSSSNDIVVVGPNSFDLSVQIPVTDLSQVHVGETAQVTSDGQNDPANGQVTQVGPPPVDGSSDYPVTIALGDQPGLFDGASASASIVVATASHVVTVPTSAIHMVGRESFVDLLRNGKPDTATVRVGVIGPERTQIVSGVQSGDTVVLANLSEPLPTNSTTGRGAFAGIGALTGGGGGGGFRGFGGGSGASGRTGTATP